LRQESIASSYPSVEDPASPTQYVHLLHLRIGDHSSLRVPDADISIAGKVRLSRPAIEISSELPCLYSSKITSSFAAVATRAERMVSDRPPHITRAPKKPLGRCNAVASDAAVSNFCRHAPRCCSTPQSRDRSRSQHVAPCSTSPASHDPARDLGLDHRRLVDVDETLAPSPSLAYP